MLHHYLTKYKDENEKRIIVSWMQLNLFGNCYCFSKKYINLED